MPVAPIELGTVRAIYRYPVKSLRGEPLETATFRWTGIDGDRQYAFLRSGNLSRAPWLTGRQMPELVSCAARYITPEDPRRSPVRVTFGGREYDIGDAELSERLSRAAGEEVRPIQLGRGIFDMMPVSVLSSTTVAALEARFAGPIDVRRFRPNIVIEVADGTAREMDWMDGTLLFGDGPRGARLRVNVAIDRCVMITIDPDTAERDPTILRGVVEDFDNEIGARCTVEMTGAIRTGDRVRLLRSDFAISSNATVQEPTVFAAPLSPARAAGRCSERG